MMKIVFIAEERNTYVLERLEKYASSIFHSLYKQGITANLEECELAMFGR
jgi:hypothetical protein